ncbi:hypothetical protein F2P56_023859 [Juglans regia]|uniref:histidine kinase n=2 Tax=Juglans regia TaxID=51240 RepID=A0A2I4HL29_JUGRE|nr:histidine kinase CKI1-like [Juglans regia]KAF5454176.1 hypothetical protein F2P56_023859 [Juglans regia]
MVTSLSVFIFSIVRAAKREMLLCAALVKQLDATQQAERKSMNKSHAFATASHDIRASLAAIIGSIEICNQDFNPNSVVAANLGQMSTRAQELLADQRRKVLMNYIESLNIRVSCVKQGKNLHPHLEKIKQKLEISYFSFFEKTQMDHPRISTSFNSDSGLSDRPLCIKDGNYKAPLPTRHHTISD